MTSDHDKISYIKNCMAIRNCTYIPITNENDVDLVYDLYKNAKIVQTKSGIVQNYYGIYFQFQKDYVEAVKWYNMSAENGNVYAMNNLGNLYYAGNGVQPDLKKAYALFKSSAKGGSPDGMKNLADHYFLGQGVEKNVVKAIKWYKKAADCGNGWAKHILKTIIPHQEVLDIFLELVKKNAMNEKKIKQLQSTVEIDYVQALENFDTYVKQVKLDI